MKQTACIFMDPITDGKKIFSVLTPTIICRFVTSWKAIMSDTPLGTERQ